MPDARFRTAHLDDVPAIPPGQPGEPLWRPVRHHLGVDAFGVNAYVAAAPGDLVIEEHDELEAPGAGTQSAPHQELYYVAAGHVTFTLDGETVEAPAGTLVFVADPGVRRAASAHAVGDTVLAFGAPAGASFEVSGWERRNLSAPAS